MKTQDRELVLEGGDRFPLPDGQSSTEFSKLLVQTVFALKQSVERQNASGCPHPLSFSKYHTGDGRSVPCVTGQNNSFTLDGRAPLAGSRDGFSLEATIWSGGPPSPDGFAFDKPRPQTCRAVHLGYSIANGYVWVSDDGADEYSSQGLAEDLMGWYLDNGR